jgi:hypothetical protein
LNKCNGNKTYWKYLFKIRSKSENKVRQPFLEARKEQNKKLRKCFGERRGKCDATVAQYEKGGENVKLQ